MNNLCTKYSICSTIWIVYVAICRENNMKYCVFVVILFLYINSSFAINDQDVLNEGQILAQKLYSESEATYVVNRYTKVYICSVIDSSTNCLLSKIGHED